MKCCVLLTEEAQPAWMGVRSHLDKGGSASWESQISGNSLGAPRCEPPYQGWLLGWDRLPEYLGWTHGIPGGGKGAVLGNTWALVDMRCVLLPIPDPPLQPRPGDVGETEAPLLLLGLALSPFLLLKCKIKWCWSKEPSVRIAAAPSLGHWDKGKTAGGR